MHTEVTKSIQIIEAAIASISARRDGIGIDAPDWKSIKRDVEGFDHDLRHLSKGLNLSPDAFDDFVSDEKTMDIISMMFNGGLPDGHDRLGNNRALAVWIRTMWPIIKDRLDLHKINNDIGQSLGGVYYYAGHVDDMSSSNRMSAIKEYKHLLGSLKTYVSILSKYTSQATDETFIYRGINIQNPWRVTELKLSSVLDDIDYLLALFKKRSVSKVITATVSSIVPMPKRSIVRVMGGNYAGYYSTITRSVVISIDEDESANGRVLKNWMHEILLHEVGHTVHLSYLSPAAVQWWDSGWDEINSLKSSVKVTHKERSKYWGLLQEAKGDLRKIKMKGIERAKFHLWLASPMLNESMVTPKRLRWSARGKRTLARYMEDPALYIEEHGPRSEKVLRSTMAVTPAYESQKYPTLTTDDLEKFSEYRGDVSKAFDRLGIPTDYGKKDHKEDFAETFVQFMVEPHKLSDMALYRMQRALHMSGLYGKKVMHRVGANKKDRQ